MQFGKYSKTRITTKQIAISSILASTYVSIGYFVPYISFGQYQCRIQDSLYALIPLFGLSGVAGCFIGHLIYNIYGFSIGMSLGALDLFSPFIFLIPKVALWKFGLKVLPLHVLFVALWVGYLLNTLFSVPLLVGAVIVGIGEAIAEGLGVPIYLLLRKEVKSWI